MVVVVDEMISYRMICENELWSDEVEIERKVREVDICLFTRLTPSLVKVK